MTAPPVEARLVVTKGATWRRKWTLTNPGDPETPIDLSSGYTAKGQVRRWYGDDIVLFEWSADQENIELRANGEIEITVAGSDSAAWAWWYGVYDIELVGPDTEPIRIAAGSVVVSPEVTQ